MNLKIYSAEDVLLVHLRQHLGVTTIVDATIEMRPAAERWLTVGLNEWVYMHTTLAGHTTGMEVPRNTPASSYEFLFRLRDYLQNQFNSFRYEIDVEVFK